MTYRTVLNINILASATRSFRSPPGQVTFLGLRREYQLVVSEHILITLDAVPQRPYFAAFLPPERRQSGIAELRTAAVLVESDSTIAGIAEDEDDDLVLGTAVAAGADYLVTGDQGLLAIGAYESVRILTARQFLDILESE